MSSLGKHWKLSEESKVNHSISMRGKLKGVPKSKEHKRKISEALKGHKVSRQTRELISNSQKGIIRLKTRGPLNYAWKGDRVGYFALHNWIRRTYKKPSHCEKCGRLGNTRQIQWANLSGKYKRDKSDWMALCGSCHYILDKMRNFIENI